ncbi:MAG: helix-turn-helix domain-containing protein [Bdellovibrionales bacterium]
MFCFGLISSDEPLRHALAEQLKSADGDRQCAMFESLETALAAWCDTLPELLFWDCETAQATDEMARFFAFQLEKARPAPLLLTLGVPPDPIEAYGVSERFVRPLRLGYFLTRLHFFERVLRQSPDISFPLRSWVFLPRKRSLAAVGAQTETVLKLTEKETALLEYLCASDKPVPREELLASVWGYDDSIDTHTLETHIYRLRRKLAGPEGEAPDPFVLEAGGYRLSPAWRSA